MANIVKILWSKITGHVPSALVDGQIAINQKDKKMFYPDENGVVTEFNINSESSFLNLISKNNIAVWLPTGNATATSLGFPTPNITGSQSARAINFINLATRQKRIGIISGATANSMSEFRIGIALVSCGSGILNDGSGLIFKTRFIPSNSAVVTGDRFFIGLTTSTIAATNVEPSILTNVVGLAKLSTDTTQFYLVYGGSSAQTPIALGTALGSPISLSTELFELSINSPQIPANTYEIIVKNITTGVIVTQTITGAAAVVPQSNQALAYKCWKTNNATALQVAFDIVSVYFEVNNN